MKSSVTSRRQNLLRGNIHLNSKIRDVLKDTAILLVFISQWVRQPLSINISVINLYILRSFVLLQPYQWWSKSVTNYVKSSVKASICRKEKNLILTHRGYFINLEWSLLKRTRFREDVSYIEKSNVYLTTPYMHTTLEQSQQKSSNCTKIKNNTLKKLQGFPCKEKYMTKFFNRSIFCHNENRKK